MSNHLHPASALQPSADIALIHWNEDGQARTAHWRSERSTPPPTRVQLADDTLSADAAYRLACEGTALLWRGDFHNARQLLDAMSRRTEQRPRRKSRTAAIESAAPTAPGSAFHLHRQRQAQRARVLSQLLIALTDDYTIEARRAPDHRLAFEHAWGPPEDGAQVVALRELLGIVGAFEWFGKGVPVAALGPAPSNRIHVHYGVFSPLRGEYVDLVARTPLPAQAQALAWELGTGSGVLAAVLARRGVSHVVATEQDPRALACAADNFRRLGLEAKIELLCCDLYPPDDDQRSPLIVCNPPWIPARAGTAIERAVYDENSTMLRAFLRGLRSRLAPGGEGWLILSDIAEHLGLRTRAELVDWITSAGLNVLERIDTRPEHPKTRDATNPLHAARAAEITSLWRLGAK